MSLRRRDWTFAGKSERVAKASGERARRDHVRSSERGKDVVEGLLVESVEQIHLDSDRNSEAGEVRAHGEVPHGSGRDPVGIEGGPVAETDVRQCEGIVG